MDALSDYDASCRGGVAPPPEAQRILVQLWLSLWSRVSTPDIDGWWRILPRSPKHPVGN